MIVALRFRLPHGAREKLLVRSRCTYPTSSPRLGHGRAAPTQPYGNRRFLSTPSQRLRTTVSLSTPQFLSQRCPPRPRPVRRGLYLPMAVMFPLWSPSLYSPLLEQMTVSALFIIQGCLLAASRHLQRRNISFGNLPVRRLVLNFALLCPSPELELGFANAYTCRQTSITPGPPASSSASTKNTADFGLHTAAQSDTFTAQKSWIDSRGSRRML